MKLERIQYADLNPRAKEIYNFHKIAAILADYGYNSIWLSNDWNGADFVAVHIDGVSDVKVQLKGGIYFAKKYIGKNLFIGFLESDALYLYPHDLVLEQVEQTISDRKWIESSTYFQTKITSRFREILAPYKIPNGT